jgi:carboxylesterase
MWEYLIGLWALLRALTGIRFFLIKRKVAGPIEINPQAEPFFKKVNGSKVALLIHGFTASPLEFRDLSNYLASKGISSYAPLLPGHGTSPERLAVIKYYQWIESVQESIDMLAKDYKEIYLVGSSFGGNLSLLSSNYSNKIKGIITIATPIFFRKHKLNRYLFLPILRRIKLFQNKPKRVRDFIDTHNGSYKVIPLRAAYEMSKIVNRCRKDLVSITKPILIIHVKKDTVVSEESHKYILANVKSRNKLEYEVAESNHVALLGEYSKQVNKEIAKFIE